MGQKEKRQLNCSLNSPQQNCSYITQNACANNCVPRKMQAAI